MEEHRGTRFSRSGLRVGARDLPLWAGEVHYWRLDPSEWRPTLVQLAAMGFTCVSSFVPWSVHEESAARMRWTGRADLAEFASIAHEVGLGVIVRPGPAANAELTLFGFPERVLANEGMSARTGLGTRAWLPAPPRMFPIPSYASTEFIAEATGWFHELGKVLAPLGGPDGPIVAVQLDDELGMFFRTGAYDLDYHPDALAWWAEHSGALEAPRAWSDEHAERCARWVDFKDFYSGRALEWIAGALDEAGLGELARFHNAPTVRANAVGAVRAGLRAQSLPAWNLHLSLAKATDIRDIALYLDGSCELAFASEIGVGAASFAPSPRPTAQAAAAITALGSGVRAFNMYMMAARNRWTDAGLETPEGDWVASLLAALHKLEWQSLHRDVSVAVIETRADLRYAAASSTVGPVTPQLAGLLDLGPGGFAELGRDSDARASARWRSAIAGALDAFEIPFVFIDEAASLERMSRYDVVICPTLRRIDAGLWEKLLALAGTEADETRVVLGPGRPSIDAFGKPLEDLELTAGMGLLRPETLGDRAALGNDLAAVCGELADDWIAPDAHRVACTVMRRNNGEPAALTVSNFGPAVVAQIAVPPATRLTDVLSAESIADDGSGAVAISIAAGDARLFAIEAATEAAIEAAIEAATEAATEA